MRVFLYASLVAFGAATDYDDDDLNFLRLLQSNASNATTVPATTAPATTVVSSNVTTAPATTVAAATSTSTPGTTNTGTPPTEDICLAATYINNGFANPGTLTQSTKGLGAVCANGDVPYGLYMGPTSAEATTMYNIGERALSTANKAKCVSPMTLIEHKCQASADQPTKDWFDMQDQQGKAAILHECCGVAPTPYQAAAAPTGATLYAFPSYKRELFSDNTCATAATAAQLTAAYGPLYTTLLTGNKLEISGCFDMGYIGMGLYSKVITCNSTATPTANDKRFIVSEMHLQSTCDKTPWSAGLSKMTSCVSTASGDRRLRQMQAGNSSTVLYDTEQCIGGSAISTLEIKTALEVVLSGLGSLTGPQKNTVLSTTCIKLRDETKTATGDSAATATVESCTGTGALAAASFSGRRVRRRLASHAATINAVIATQVSAAGAAAAKAALDTAAASGTLSSTTLAASVVTALKQESSIASAVANVNATVAVTVYEPTLPTTSASTGGGSTAGAFAQGLSAVVGFLIMAMLFV